MLELRRLADSESCFPIGEQRVTVGRAADNHIVLDDDSVSGYHAVLFCHDGAVQVIDLGSANGTSVDQQSVSGRVDVRPWQRLAFGSVEFELFDSEQRRPTRIMQGIPEPEPDHDPEPAQNLAVAPGELHTSAASARSSPPAEEIIVASSPDPQHGWLEPLSASGAAQKIELSSITRIGRTSDNDLVLDSPTVSSTHARIVALGGLVEVVDLDSTNGTRVNGRAVSKCSLADGDVIAFDDVEYVYRAAPGAAKAHQDRHADVEPGVEGTRVRPAISQVSESSPPAPAETFGAEPLVESLRTDSPRHRGKRSHAHNAAADSSPITARTPDNAGSAIHHSSPSSAQRPASNFLPWSLAAVCALALVATLVYFSNQPGGGGRQMAQGPATSGGQVSPGRTVAGPSGQRSQPATRTVSSPPAHQVSRAASSRELRSRMQNLAIGSEATLSFLGPFLHDLDRMAGIINGLTGNPVSRRLLQGTEFAGISSQINQVSSGSQEMIRDLQSMPADLQALERALARYQSNPSDLHLLALDEPTNRVIQQAARLSSSSAQTANGLNLIAAVMDQFARVSTSWPGGREISQASHALAQGARRGSGEMSRYSRSLSAEVRHLEQIRSDIRNLERNPR